VLWPGSNYSSAWVSWVSWWHWLSWWYTPRPGAGRYARCGSDPLIESAGDTLIASGSDVLFVTAAEHRDLHLRSLLACVLQGGTVRAGDVIR